MLYATLYVTLALLRFPAMSEALTVNVCEPSVDVSSGLPLDTGPAQLATPEVASVQE
jgi:hypothetical protein